ncbi:MAG: hypothetical protein Q9165_008337 [Trypethelium subeluteriae]
MASVNTDTTAGPEHVSVEIDSGTEAEYDLKESWPSDLDSSITPRNNSPPLSEEASTQDDRPSRSTLPAGSITGDEEEWSLNEKEINSDVGKEKYVDDKGFGMHGEGEADEEDHVPPHPSSFDNGYWSPAEDKVRPTVKRLSMSKWTPMEWESLYRPEIRSHALVAYYSQKSWTSLAVSQAHEEESAEERIVSGQDNQDFHADSPQRIQINSRELMTKIEAVSKTHLKKVNPVVMVPPFKVLVSKLGALEESLNQKRASNARIHDCTGNREEFASRSEDGHFSPREQTIEELETENIIDHLQVLVDFIKTDLKDILELRRKIAEGTLSAIAFDDLWHLFKPGDTVFATERVGSFAYRRAYIVCCVSGGRPEISIRSWKSAADKDNARAAKNRSVRTYWRNDFVLDSFGTAFDGTHYGTAYERFRIKPFDSEKLITDLDVYPTKFHPQEKDELEKLLQRGRRFRELDHPSHKMYEGPAQPIPDDMGTADVYGEVEIDTRTGYQYSNAEKPVLCKQFNLPDPSGIEDETFEPVACVKFGCEACTWIYDDHASDSASFSHYQTTHANLISVVDCDQEDLLIEQLLLLPKFILGYVFRSRSWNWLDVDLVKDIDDDEARRESGFDELVLPKGHKDLVLALVKNHSSGSRKGDRMTHSEVDPLKMERLSMDMVKDKGKGLIILLHGVPGVGKTSTADTVAVYTGRPLYPITCGDVGSTPEEIETRMERHFKLAHKWGCVLLLDEADVFLDKRERGDILRNGLVSGKFFFESLNIIPVYFFLTTNRVGSFDEAFKSRIHLPLYYPPLDQKSTLRLWKNCLQQIEKQNKIRRIEIKYDEGEILDFATERYDKSRKTESSWNGRQIRNAFQTAVALAEYDLELKIKKKSVSEEKIASKKKYRTATLTVSHFEKVGRTVQDFDHYVNSIHQASEQVRAGYDGIRADAWSPQDEPIPSAFRGIERGPAQVMGFSKQYGSPSRTKRAKPEATPVDDSDKALPKNRDKHSEDPDSGSDSD